MADSPLLEWTKLGVGAIAVMVALRQYQVTSTLTARTPYLTKQTELCLNASEQASRLASTLDKDEWMKARNEFRMLFHGPLEVVEEADLDPLVAKAMKEVSEELDKFGLDLPKSLPVSEIKIPSNDVAFACRDLIRSKWTIHWFGI